MSTQNISKLTIWRDYILTYFVIAFSGIPFFDNNRYFRMYFLIIALIIFALKGKKFSLLKIVSIGVIYIVLILIQSYSWGSSYFTIFTSLSFTIILPYLLLQVIGIKFIKYAVNIICIYAVISLFFWLATNFILGFHEFTRQLGLIFSQYSNIVDDASFIIYTYEKMETFGLVRNPGPFHEPGAFAVFLIFALVFNIIFSNNIKNKKNIVLLLALITTFSTAGYFAFFVLTIIFLQRSRMSNVKKIVIFFFIVAMNIYIFTTAEFLQEKVSSQYKIQTTQQLSTPTSGRFLGARKAIIVLVRHPFGRGILASTKADFTSEEAAGYGWITWMSRLGIIFGTMYMYYLFLSIKKWVYSFNLSKIFAILSFIAFLVILTGQKHTPSILFMMLVQFAIIYPQHYINYYKKYILSYV